MSSSTEHSSNADLRAYQYRTTEEEIIHIHSKEQTAETTRKEMQANDLIIEIGPVQQYLPLKNKQGKVVARIDKFGKVLSGDISKISDEARKEMNKFLAREGITR